MVHYYSGAFCHRICYRFRRNSEYPDGRYSSDLILSVGYLRVGLFLEQPERHVEQFREQRGYLRQGLFSEDHHAVSGGDDQSAGFRYPVSYLCGVLYLLCRDRHGADDPLADCAVPAPDADISADGGWFRYDFLLDDDQVSRSADHVSEDHLAMGVYHAGDLSAEYGDE